MAPVNYNKTYLEVEVVMKFSVLHKQHFMQMQKSIVDKEVKRKTSKLTFS
jgi:hypothetical protein